jgi:hypothetical protein
MRLILRSTGKNSSCFFSTFNTLSHALVLFLRPSV